MASLKVALWLHLLAIGSNAVAGTLWPKGLDQLCSLSHAFFLGGKIVPDLIFNSAAAAGDRIYEDENWHIIVGTGVRRAA